MIRAGRYQQVLHLTKSGTASAYIGFAAYQDEKVVISGVNSQDQGEQYGAIWLDEVSYNLVNGLTVEKSIGFGRFINAHHNIFSGNHFSGSSLYNNGKGASKRGGLYIAFSDHNSILNNHFQKGTDILALVHSNYNLVEGNEMSLAGHDLWNIKCGSYNVIRNNIFSNKKQKIGSVFDCESATMNWHGNGQFKQIQSVLDASKHNLIEHNIFKDAVRYYSASGGNGIQYAGQQGIVRFNLFYHTNVGFSLSSYQTEAAYNYGNRIYNNTFHDNWCVGIAIGRWKKRFEDNQFVNNLLWNNQGLTKNQCKDQGTQQILFVAKQGDQWFLNNNIGNTNSDKVIGLWGKSPAMSVYDFEGSFIPVQFKDSLAQDPLFVNSAKGDYQLSAASPMIDKGVLLTEITSDNDTGDVLTVADSQFFFDGQGIAGISGDKVMILSKETASLQSAQIVKVDNEQRQLYLDKAVTWEKGDQISLAYSGEKPDIGAFEYVQK
ncbi:right-handed parallel beta-helix repeat-containing protein [Psychromonas sp. KJ10-2]|uniref:right-handed parallel beta-helix repeat-containing protein n=1 Tax=Psychromonas sp. KJ10-2 TaxID=3391822 RepID=UPI0039B51DC2